MIEQNMNHDEISRERQKEKISLMVTNLLLCIHSTWRNVFTLLLSEVKTSKGGVEAPPATFRHFYFRPKQGEPFSCINCKNIKNKV